MRVRKTAAGLTVNAVAGSYVVLLGLSVDDNLRAALRGFAIKREDKTEGETFWMKGVKTFASVEPHPARGEQFSSLIHPFQTFQWADYSAKPGHNYAYTVVMMNGVPGALTKGGAVTVDVTTEQTDDVEHSIHFNRGSVATQEYQRRFLNLPPSEAGQGAYDWLSRGLVEGIVDFIRRAQGAGFGLKGAFYEFQWPAILKELREAKARGADVQIVFDDIDNSSGPHGANEDAIALANITALCKARTKGTLMHNKFLVLTVNAKPQAVLFGSTNLTENGLFGHANCTHVVEDSTVAAHYLDFFDKLLTDPDTKHPSAYKDWTVEQTPAPAEVFVKGMAAVFSPRSNMNALKWYAALAGGATTGLFMTFAFGMNQLFRDVYGKADNVLRFGLMEKEWNGRNKEAQIEAIRRLQALPNVVIAIGNRIPLNGFDRWLGELDRIIDHVNVHWVHLKFMLVDPLSEDPIVVTGSANFSESSTTTNDENMLVIKGNKRVADIYLGEYMRLYSHYAFREAVQIFLKNNPHAKPEDMKQGFLIEQGDWTKPYFDPQDRSARMARRLYFAG